jgi:hypothetical protein
MSAEGDAVNGLAFSYFLSDKSLRENDRLA